MQAFKKILVFILINILLAGAMQFMLRSYPYFESKKYDYYEEDYNSIVIGSSFGHNIDLTELPESDNVLDMCYPGIHFLDYYYIIKEMNEHKRIDRIYMEFSLEYWTGEAGAHNIINMAEMLTGINELDYFLNVLGDQDYNSFFFPYRLTGPAIRKIPSNIKKKIDAITGKKEEKFQGNFVVENDNVNMNFKPTLFSPDIISDDAISSFLKIANYCKENDIDLIIFSTAFAKERLLAENVGDVHDYFTNFFEENGIKFYDMNYARWDLLPRKTEQYNDLHGHMKPSLIKSQTQLLTKMIESDEPEQFFVNSYQEVLEGLEKMESIIL